MISEKTVQIYNTFAKKQNSLINEFPKYINNFANKQNYLVSNFCEYIDEVLKKDKEVNDERDRVKEDYGFVENDKFNILTEYNILTGTREDWSETIHSKLLCRILDPKTPVIGGKNNLIEFFKLIDCKDFIPSWNFNKTFVEIEVTAKKLAGLLGKEYNSDEIEDSDSRIDIFICDGKNCIIIENKITNAPNRQNQLQRYVRIAKNQGLKVQKVVYMPPTKDKDPDECEDEYKEEQKEIVKNNLLVKIPAVKSVVGKDNINSLAQDFFPSIMKEEFSESNKTRLVFFDQYKKIIARLGENEIMKNMEKELVKLLCGKPENQKRTNDLYELLNDDRFDELKFDLILEELKIKYNLEFIPDDDEDYWKILINCRKETNDDVCFYIGKGEYGVETKDKSRQFHNDLKEKIIKSGIDKGEFKEGNHSDWWYYTEYGFDELSIEECAELISNTYSKIQNALKK